MSGLSPDLRRQVVAGARRAFARYGVRRTTMDDIAHEAGVSRATLYRHTNRADLIELALVETVRDLGDEIRATIDPDPDDLAKAFVDALVASVLITRQNDEFAYLAAAVGRVPLTETLSAGHSDVQQAVADLLAPLLQRARAEDVLRTDVAEEDLINWIQGILVLVTPRSDLDAEQLRRRMTKFVIPVVLRGVSW